MAIKDIVLPNGEKLVIDEWLHYPIYSTIEFASTSAPNLRAFSYTKGQQVSQVGLTPRTATEADTNQVARNRMNHDEAFVVYAVTYEHFALSSGGSSSVETNPLAGPTPVLVSTNLRRLQRDVVVSLLIGAGISKPQFRCPFAYLRQGVGATAWASGDAIDTNMRPTYGTGGHIHSHNERRLNLPILIESDRVMSLKVESPIGAVPGLSQNVRLRFYLDGLKRRPVG